MPASVNFSITCSDDEISLKVEPGAATTSERFQAIEHLAKSGINTGVLMDPIMPYLTDTEENVREMVRKAKHYGARYIYISTSVTTIDVQRDYFYEQAEKISPGIAAKYREKYDCRYRCVSPKSKRLMSAFLDECEKVGMNCSMKAANEGIRRNYPEFQESFLKRADFE